MNNVLEKLRDKCFVLKQHLARQGNLFLNSGSFGSKNKTQDSGKKKYYCIRVTPFWLIVVFYIAILTLAYFKDELHEKWLYWGGMENVTYEQMKSKLGEQKLCRLCGDNNDSLTGYYHQSDTIGVIWLNDWYTVDFRLKSCDQNGNRTDGVGGPSCITGNIGETAYSLKCHSKGAMASLEIVFPENYELNKEKIQEYLCQECLDKVPQLLTFRKWKYEKEEAIPFCLVDFQTMELYSLQEGDVGYAIRDYWVEIERGKNTVSIDAYVLSA